MEVRATRIAAAFLIALLASAASAALAADAAGVEMASPAPPGPAPPAAARKRLSVFELLERGGPVMYPIYACSILALAFAIERAVSLRRRAIVPPRFPEMLRALVARRPIKCEQVLAYCAANPSPPARILGAAVKRLHRPVPEIEKTIEDTGLKEARLMRRNTRVLMVVANVAPLLGFLGTVFGMIAAFQEVSAGQALGKAELLAVGIYEALVTTAAGLTVAIRALVAYLFFNAKIEKIVAELDALALEFVDAVVENGSAEAQAPPRTRRKSHENRRRERRAQARDQPDLDGRHRLPALIFFLWRRSTATSSGTCASTRRRRSSPGR